MIFSSFNAKDDWGKYPKAIQTALCYLKENDIAAMNSGTYEIMGRDIYVQVVDTETAPVADKRPEVHEEYIDIQYLASGEETLGFTPDTGNYTVTEKNPEKDIAFYEAVENENFIHATPGCYTIFFPCDVHRPAVMTTEPMKIRKAIVKVRASLV